jgi:uncharacterized protein YndB with AHSA1/START domain
MTSTAIESIVREIVIQAPAERVFAAIAEPEQRIAWWGVKGRFEVTHMESDLRPGGAWQMSGTAAEGNAFTLRGEYTVIDRPRVLEFTWQASWSEPQSLVRFDLVEQDGATTVRVTHSQFATQEARDKYQGWPWLLSMLQSYVEKSSPS